jgi:hypothetical protein
MPNNARHIYLGVFLLVVFFSACVKDTDFDKANDIVVSPIVDLDLIYFDLPANRFFDNATSSPILTVRDTTGLPFLNDSEIRDNVKRIVFSFTVTNSIQREFQLDFEFLNRGNNVVYTSQMTVFSGTIENPTVVEFIDTVEGQDLLNLTKAERLAVSVAIASSNQNLSGNINLQSIATYFIEF